MANENDYADDEDLMVYLDDARGLAARVVGGNATDLHILVAGQADPAPVSRALEYPAFVAMKNQQDAKGMTPLMYAADQLKLDIINRLSGTQTGLKNNEGKTALDLFDDARNADPEALEDVSPEDLAAIRRGLGAAEGGRRKKTRARQPRQPRKTRRRQTRRRR
jgi:hypothetical protein